MTRDASDPQLPYSGEIWRKALHLLSLSIPIGLLLFGRPLALSILVPLTVVFVVAEILQKRSNTVRDLISRGFGFMMRSEELRPVASPVHFNGATWVLLSACLVVGVFEPSIAASALVIGLIGDAAAALVGRRFGRHAFGGRGKSLEGSLAFIVASFPAALLVPGIPPLSSGIAVLAAALVEGLGGPLNDNLSVPLAAGIALSLV